MEYLVAIDGRSPYGSFLLSLKNKIGGASAWLELMSESHPVIVATDLDWTKLPAFVRMTHIRNPGAPDPQPRELVVPSSCVLAVLPKEPPATEQPAAQQTPPTSLH